MNPRILLVDDDAMLLRSLERNLCFDYEISLAESGAAALEVINSATPFTVVLTDMRMPGMSGLEFITAARGIAPDTIYCMLTGNQDLDTAISAVNEGRVFRFLTKPTEIKAIRSTLDSAHRQYELVAGEKELLNKTCAGAVGMLIDMLERANPTLGKRLSSLRSVFEELRVKVGIIDRWEYNLASRLALVGFICLNEEQSLRFVSGNPTTPEWKQALAEATRLTSQMVGRIPRLTAVSEIIAACTSTNGIHCHTKPSQPAAIVQTGATLLYVALLWDTISYQGVTGSAAINELRAQLPNILPAYLQVLKNLSADSTCESTVEIAFRQLTEGMVLAGDIRNRDGSILLRVGTRITVSQIERLKEKVHELPEGGMIKLFASSMRQQIAPQGEAEQVSSDGVKQPTLAT